jgi:hypothetical protein
MSPRRIIRPALWTIGPDREEGASPPIRQSECTTCDWQSVASTRQEVTDLAAMEHAGLTNHTGYREIVTAFLRVAPTAGNPRAKQRQVTS